jgi:hypothetical protein
VVSNCVDEIGHNTTAFSVMRFVCGGGDERSADTNAARRAWEGRHRRSDVTHDEDGSAAPLR